MLLEEVSISTRNEVDNVLWIRRNGSDSSSSLLGRNGMTGYFDDGGESSLMSAEIFRRYNLAHIIVKEEQSLLGRFVF